MFFFFFNDTATTEIYTLSLHDALPICLPAARRYLKVLRPISLTRGDKRIAVYPSERFKVTYSIAFDHPLDRKSTRLNSSHANISYAVFCLKKKKNTHKLLHHTNMN